MARGQGEDFWIGRVSKLLPVLDRQMAEFKSALASPAAQADLESATAAIENFHKLDARAQEYVKGSDPLLASDLIFSDGLGTMGTAAAQVRAALKDELQAREADAAGLKMRELTILSGGAGGVLIILMIRAVSGASKAVEAERVSEPVASAPVGAGRLPKVVGGSWPPGHHGQALHRDGACHRDRTAAAAFSNAPQKFSTPLDDRVDCGPGRPRAASSDGIRLFRSGDGPHGQHSTRRHERRGGGTAPERCAPRTATV